MIKVVLLFLKKIKITPAEFLWSTFLAATKGGSVLGVFEASECEL
jgi:hypothetical protein